MKHGSGTPAATAAALLTTAVVLLGLPSPALGQGAAPGAPLGTVRTAIEDRMAVDSFLALVPGLDTARIDGKIGRIRAAERDAGERRARDDRDRRRTREVHDQQVMEIDRAARAIRIADDLDQASRKRALEDERRLRQRYRDLLAVRVEALERSVLAAEAAQRHARAVRERLVTARELAEHGNEWRALPEAAVPGEGAGNERAALAEEIQDRLADYFRALRDEEEAAERLAASRRAAAEKRVELVERRAKLFDD